MEDSVFSPGTMLGAPLDSAMDLDYMDELLSEGCWLETIDGSEFPYPSPAFSTALFDAPFQLPPSETINGDTSPSPSQQSNQEGRPKLFLPGNSPRHESQGKSPVDTQSPSQSVVNVDSSFSHFENFSTEGSELSKRWWIGPKANLGPSTTVMQRLMRALEQIKDLTNDKDVLIQLWVPVNRAGRRVLTTYDQPFQVDPNCQRLANYRNVSVNYYFSAEKDSKALAGLPGRVFLCEVPEWTPDVQFFRSDEYPRVDHAQQYDVRGTLAIPVFEQGSRTCLGVIEVVMTTRKIKYRSELETMCKALEAFDLRSSEVLSAQKLKVCKRPLPEIQEVLRCACETHRLPLAQTWVPCIQQGKGGCWHSDEKVHCVSTIDHVCYVADPDMKRFHEACSEHHLLKGQGVAGEAFLTNQPCFSTDITSYKKIDYPLSHHAKMFGLRGAVAIRLRSIHTGTADFVLEFFLPKDCRNPEEQMKMLSSLSTIIQKVCQSLRVVTDKELEEETCFPTREVIVPSDGGPSIDKMSEVDTHSEKCSQENSSWTASLTEVQIGDDPLNQREKSRVSSDEKLLEVIQQKEDFSIKGEKRRTKAEKTITLQVLRKYFAGSLKDAAKSIGVCPTTLKRICRQHGIKRWPSRKIKKVGHSLQKLQVVIDSVQGGAGAFQFGSFYTKFPDLASPNLSATGPFSTSMLTDPPKPPSIQPKGGILIPQARKSPSCSQSSSSSHCCSSGTQQPPSASNVAGVEDPMVGESSGDALKMVRSDAELHASSEEPKLLPRSQSNKSLREQPISETLPSFPEDYGQISRDVDLQRVKVTFGDEKIRFRMPNNWKFKDLLQEVARRFNIDNMSRFGLKYLDDDSEWVLLTCDADLEECIYVWQSSENHTIKLSLQVSHHLSERVSGSSGSGPTRS